MQGEVRSIHAHTITSKRGIIQANYSSDTCPLAASKNENQKASHLGAGVGLCAWPWWTLLHPSWETRVLHQLSEMPQGRQRGDKQEGSEICVRSQGHDLTAVTETRWGSSCGWNAGMDGCVLSSKARPARRGGGVALYVKEQLGCVRFCLGVDEE